MSLSKLFRMLLLLCLALPAWAQDWPAKTVKFVSPYPPGGSVDPLARLFAMLEIVTGAERVPERSMRRARNCALWSANSIHVASAAPSGSNSTSTRPSDPPSSTRMGAPNVAPLSPEKAR